jgi:hypothetical protein
MEQPVFYIGARHPVPDSMAAVAPFAETSVPDFSRRPVMATPAPATPFAAATLTRLSDTVSGDNRTLRLQIDAPDADRVQIFADGDDPEITGLLINDQRIIRDAAPLPVMSCVGRRCRSITLDITLARDIETLALTLTALRYGLDETAQGLTAARPNWAGPQHQGDSRRVRSHISLPLGREEAR